MGRLAVLLSSGLGLGFLPKAPGTFGTLWGIVLFFGLHDYPLHWVLPGMVLLFLAAVFLAQAAEKTLQSHDSSIIVIDEVVGYGVTVLGFHFSWPLAVAAFAVFRFFDILKPYPIRWIDQRVPGGWGVVLDDVLAGVYANIFLRLGIYLWQRF